MDWSKVNTGYTCLFAGLYTLFILGIAQMAPNQGKGIMTESNGKNSIAI